jgi:hypothetical protein
MNVRDSRLINKKKQLVDVAPHWGEPRISCVDGLLCAIMFMLWICLVNLLLFMLDIYMNY